MRNLDVDNMNNLDESFSNFRAFGIGKPSQRQADKWEVKKPAKYARLVKKGKITVAEKEVEAMPESTIFQNNNGSNNGSKIASDEKPKNTAIIISGIVGGVVILSVTLFLIFRKK